MGKKKVAILTSGGLAPCLSVTIAKLIENYTQKMEDWEIILYLNGFKGLRDGNSISVTNAIRANTHILYEHGGSPIGNSRVKLTNDEDEMKPNIASFEAVKKQLMKDRVDILHVIGGGDTNTTAAKLVEFLEKDDYKLTVVGLVKTIDNDVSPIKMTMGYQTAAQEGAIFFSNIVHENSAHPRMLIVHEVMGKSSGSLAARTAYEYIYNIFAEKEFLPEIGLNWENQEVHAIFIPEMDIDIQQEAYRLKEIMDTYDDVNVFVSEGVFVDKIIKEMKERGEEVPLDAFGYPKLDKVNAGEWIGKKLAELIGAEKLLVQKSGYFARSAMAGDDDLSLIGDMVEHAVDMAILGRSGVVGNDDENNGTLSLIGFDRIKSEKPFDLTVLWFKRMMKEIGQEV